MRPGEILNLEVGSIGARGDGIANHNGVRIFLPFTAPGDKVRARIGARRGDGFAGNVLDLVREGAARQVPACRHFGTCGGCAFQHIEPETYAHWKRDLIASALSHRGLRDISVEACLVSPPGSRRRAKLAARRVKEHVVLGFHERASDRVVDLAECPVMSPSLLRAVEPVRAALGRIGLNRAEIGLLETETGLDVTVETKGEPDLRKRQTLADLAESADFARLTWARPTASGAPRDHDLIVMRRAPTLRFGGAAVMPPPDAFVQATKSAEDVMTSFMAQALDGAERLADLFAGCGTFTFPLAAKTRVLSVDGDEDLIAAARAAANRATGLKLIEFRTCDLFRRPLSAEELKSFDGVVFDPPRQGAKAQAETLAASGVPVIVAVSCDPGTFARDARILADGGYRLLRVQPIDQFLWSPHVELVAEFRRG